MPVGFKNSTDGSTQIAVDAVLTARSPHWFPSVTKQGVAAIFQTVGNDSCHVILRGGTRTGPNYGAEHIAKVSGRLAAKGLRESVMVDCSHGNSHKNHLKQADVAADLRRGDREPPRRGPPGLRARRDPRLRAEHHRRLSVLRADRAAARAARRGSAGPRIDLDPTGAVQHTRSSWLMANG